MLGKNPAQSPGHPYDGVRFGARVHHIERFGIASFDGPVLGVPLIEDGAAASMEYRLIPEAHTEDAYDTCFAEVVSAAADPLAFSGGHWQFSDANASLHTLHHLGAGNFVVAGKVISAAKPAAS